MLINSLFFVYDTQKHTYNRINTACFIKTVPVLWDRQIELITKKYTEGIVVMKPAVALDFFNGKIQHEFHFDVLLFQDVLFFAQQERYFSRPLARMIFWFAYLHQLALKEVNTPFFKIVGGQKNTQFSPNKINNFH